MNCLENYVIKMIRSLCAMSTEPSKPIHHSFINGCSALCWALASSVPYSFLAQTVGLRGQVISPRKASAYKQYNTNTE
jgi:hypothetical protein